MKASLSADFSKFIVHDTRLGDQSFEIRVKNGKYGTYHRIMYDDDTEAGGFKVKVNGTITGVMRHANTAFVFNSSNVNNIVLKQVDNLRKKSNKYKGR